MQYLSTTQLSEYLEVTKRTIQRKAVRENWPFKEQVGLGGTSRVYRFHNLPKNIQNKITVSIIAKHNGLYAPFNIKPTKIVVHQLYTQLLNLPINTTILNKFNIKLRLLELSKLFVIDFGQGKIKGIDNFCQQYNNKTLQIEHTAYTEIKSISRITLLRWEKNEQARSIYKQTDSEY